MKVTLLTKTENIMEILWIVWELSRGNDSLQEILNKTSRGRCRAFLERIINENIPLTEMVDFVFLLEDIPVSLREQLVRHRIGVKVGGHNYVDTVSDLPDSSFWSQSMRVMDMSRFEYFIPENISTSKAKTALAIYTEAMRHAAAAYHHLVEAGIAREDARNVIPLGTTHRIIWKLNLAALTHIVSKRSCWILQLGLWKPIIQGMITELCIFNPIFRQLACPPCMQGNKFNECKFRENNIERIKGETDQLPPCSLFLTYYQNTALKTSNEVFPDSKTCWYFQSDKQQWTCCDESRTSLMEKMQRDYGKFWNRNIKTGEKLP